MQLSTLNSSSPDYSKFEQETFGEQVIGTTADFTDAEIQKYIALLTAKSQGIDVDTNIYAKLEYGFGGPSDDLERLELFKELTTTNNPTGAVIVSTTASSIPANAIPNYTPTSYDQALFQKYCAAVNAGADTSSPAVQLKYGLVDFYSAINEVLQANSGLTSNELLGVTTTAGGVAALANGLMENSALYPTNYLYYVREVYSSLYDKAAAILAANSGLDPTAALAMAAAQVIANPPATIAPATTSNPYVFEDENTMSWGDLMSGMKVYIDSTTGLPDSIDLTGYTPPALAPLLTLIRAVQSAGIDPTATVSSQWSSLVSAGLANPAATTNYGTMLGDNSVEVLINLKKAGLMNDDGTIPASTVSTYNLTAQDVSDYALIYQILQAGLDPTSSTVQAQYGLTVRHEGLGANATVGTSPGAFINVISGQYSGSNGVQAIIDNLKALIALAKSQIGGTSASSIVSELTTVLGDFQAIVESGASDPIATWVTNFSNNTEGSYQTNLNNAVVASQALNDTQRENLQQVMFVYQQFYQSATSMLSSLMTLMQTVASNISAA